MHDDDAKAVHSQDYFGDTREYWWNRDYLELLAKRWNVASVKRALDVGCGFGHWTRAVGGVLPTATHWIGIDPEADSIKEAERRTRSTQLGSRALFRLGRAEAIPFHDGVFDFVTCQTLLIHVADPAVALREMVRVLAPGGILAVVEPDNLADGLAFNSRATGASDDVILGLFRLQMVCERGKRQLGEGDNSIGARLAGLFADLGLSEVQTSLGDRVASLVPPYQHPHERAALAELEKFAAIEHFVWRRKDTERYFVAGGGAASEFDRLWAMAGSERRRMEAAIAEKKWISPGGHVTYVMSAKKPASEDAPA